jgi:hypothetical protein
MFVVRPTKPVQSFMTLRRNYMFDLSGSFSTADVEALIHYKGVNRSQETIFVAHLITDVRGKAHPNSAYTALSLDGRQLNLLLTPSPLPVLADVAFCVLPLLKKVLPGEQIIGEVRLPVPADEWNAYEPPVQGVEKKLVTVQRVVLTIEVIPQSMATKLTQATSPAGYWSVGGKSILSSVVLVPDSPFQVRKRLDLFART